MIKRILFAAALLLCMTPAASAQQQMPQIPIDQQVRIGKLDNGLTYYIRHNEEPKDQAHFYIAQKVGSILEEDNQRGLAHFLEHMCFNGTEHFPGNGLIKYLESIGVKFGADLNAYTSIDETVYNIDNVPVTVPGAIDSCLWILHDWADGLLLEGEDIDKERGVIHEEWRSRQNAQMRMYEQILPKIYPNNKYAYRLPIGTMEVVDNFPYQAIRDYYEKWYRPDQQGIVVVGDINVDEIEAKIKEIFGTIATPVNPAERYYVPVEDNVEPIIAIAKDKEQPYAMTYIFKKHEPIPDEMKSSLTYLVMDYAFTVADIMVQQRLDELMMLPEPPFMQAAIQDDDFFISKTEKAYMGVVITADDGLLKGLTTVYREMLRIARNGFTASEYERAKEEYLTQLENAYNEREKTKSINYCDEYVRHFIDNEPIPGIENEYALINQLAPSVPVEAVNQLVAQLMGEDGNLVVVCMLPDKEGLDIPSEQEVMKALADVEAEDIAPYEDNVSDEPLISNPPVGGSIVKSAPAKFGYTKYTLSNGVGFYVKPTDFKADQIQMRAFSNGGLSLYPESDVINMAAANEVFTVGGLGNFSATDLTKALAGKQVSVNANISNLGETLSGSSTPKDFETMLQLVYLCFTDRREDNDAFLSYKNRLYASLVNQEMQPMSALQDSLTKVLYNGHPRAHRLKAADVDKIDYSRIMQIARERFADAADFNFIFTGNFDEDTMLPLVAQYLGALPTTSKREKYVDNKLDIVKGRKENVFSKKMETPMATVVMLASGKAKYNLKNELLMEMAGQCLDILFTEEIREKEGGTYGVQVVTDFSDRPKPVELIQIVYQTDPDKYEYLNARIHELLDEFQQNGPKETDLAKVKEYLLKNNIEDQRNNAYFSSVLREYIETGVDADTQYRQVVESITAADVAKATRKLLKQNNFKTVIMDGFAE
ncbi:MAG: insulinase family protein [Bacteroidales bacterium]|nr:insulinase family protein [Bacteroidales bacterium]